jgi:sarcosine oxidase subunit beta
MRIGVIGGGVYGVSTAYFLKRFGADEVIVFEKGNIAGESTGYSAGIVRHHYAHDVQIRMAKRGREILANLSEYTGSDGGFRNNGYVVLADPDREAEFRETVALQRDLGIDVDLVEPDDLTDHLPAIDPTGVTIGAVEHEAGFADPYLVATGFANAAADLGVEVRTGTRVTGIEADGGTATAIETEGERVPVDYVVNAAGPWGREVGEMIGVDLPLERHESKIAVLESETPYGPDLPTLADPTRQPDMYTKPEPGGEFVGGGLQRPTVDSERGLEGGGTEFLREVSERLDRRLPGYADAQVAETWSGVITVTPDAIQIAGVPRGWENVFNVVGGSGHGFKEAPAFAESIAQTVLGEEPRIDLTPYRLERFREDAAFSGISTETYSES